MEIEICIFGFSIMDRNCKVGVWDFEAVLSQEGCGYVMRSTTRLQVAAVLPRSVAHCSYHLALLLG